LIIVPNLINIPYKYGTSNILQCDCYGLIKLYASMHGVTLPNFTNYYKLYPTDLELNVNDLNVLIKLLNHSKPTVTADENIAVGVTTSGTLMFGIINFTNNTVLLSLPYQGSSFIGYESFKRYCDSVSTFTLTHFNELLGEFDSTML
jgi:hypothetical protein